MSTPERVRLPELAAMTGKGRRALQAMTLRGQIPGAADRGRPKPGNSAGNPSRHTLAQCPVFLFRLWSDVMEWQGSGAMLDRGQIANAVEIDQKLGTTNWTVRAEGSYGDVKTVHVRWLEDAGTERQTKRGGEALFRIITPGRRPRGCSISQSDVWTTDLVTELSTFHKVGNYR